MTINSILSRLLLVSLLIPNAVFAAQTFSNVFVFGDSLSDTGNLASLDKYSYLNNPPFDKAYTNGATAVKVLAQSLGLSADPSLHLLTGVATGTNYAVTGATAGLTGNPLINLGSQVTVFLANHNNEAPADALYVVFIGGNDVADALLIRNKPVINLAVAAIDENIRTLITKGAKAILVVNAPDLGITPKIKAFGPTAVKFATSKSKEFNSKLLKRLAKIEQDLKLDIVSYDFFNLSHFVYDNNISMGYTNKTDACFNSDTLVYTPACNEGMAIDKFFYFDDFHPTKVVHERIGRALYAITPAAP